MAPRGGPPTTGGAVLRRAFFGRRRLMAGAMPLIAGHQVGEALVPVVVGITIDRAVATGDVGALVLWVSVLGLVFLSFAMSWRFGFRLLQRAVLGASHELRLDLARRVLDARGGAEAGRLSGSLSSIASLDADRVGTLNRLLSQTGASLAGIVVAGVALVRLSVPLGLLVFVGTPPLLWLMHRMGAPLERRSAQEQAEVAATAGLATDLVAGLRVLKGLGAETVAVGRYRDASQQALRATMRSAVAEATYKGATIFLTTSFLALVALVGGRLALDGDISIGQLVASVGLALYLMEPMARLAVLGATFPRVRSSAERVAAVLAAPHAVAAGDGRPDDRPAGALELVDVHSGSLRGLDLQVPAGRIVGVAAAEPADAAALVACLGRSVDPAAGTVRLDGRDLQELDPRAVRRAVLVAAHDADLFEGSLVDNVLAAAAHPDDDEELDRVLRASGADEVAASLPQGPATLLTERARSLSGGQRQRVGLARALAAAPPVLVLHDPTTAVDGVTEARLADGIRALRRDRTTLLVATSPALLAVCDQVHLVVDGRVCASGTHAELAASDDTYREVVLS